MLTRLLMTLSLLGALALWPLPVEAQPKLSEVEAKVAADVEATAVAEGLPLLKRTVNINSGSGNPPGVRSVGKLFARELKGIGFEISWVELAKVKRGPHLFARHQGEAGRKTVLLIGHLDTVFEQSHPFQRFERLSEHRVRGPGVYDMKGGNVAIVQALKSLARAGALRGCNVIVAFTGDEERLGRDAHGSFRTTRDPLLRLARESDIALGFEPGGGQTLDNITIARRGTVGWRLQVSAPSAHSSVLFSRGVGPGAVYPAALVLADFYRRLSRERFLTFNAGLIAGGEQVQVGKNSFAAKGKTNIVAASAQVRGDLRTLDQRQLARAKARMRSIVGAVQRRLHRRYRTPAGQPLVRLELIFREGYPPMPPTHGNRALLAQLSEVSVALGGKPLRAFDPGKRGAADVSFVAGLVKAALGGLGPIGSGAHTAAETMDLRSLPVVAKRTAVLIHRLCRQPASDPIR